METSINITATQENGMNVKDPIVEEESNKDQKHLLSTEDINTIVKTNSMSHLSDEQIQEFHTRFIEGGEELPVPQKDQEEPKPQESPDTKEQKQTAFDKTAVPGDKYAKKADEANTFRQKYEALRKKLEDNQKLEQSAKAIRDGAKKNFKVNNDDLLDEENIKNLIEGFNTQKKSVEQMSSMIEENAKKSRLEVENMLSDLRLERMYSDIRDLQDENPELKTKSSIKSLNSKYASFESKLGGREKVDQYMKDENFRKEQEAKGISIPMDNDDWNKFSTILELNGMMRQEGVDNFDYAYYKWRKDRNIDPVKTAALQASNATVEQLSKQSNQNLADATSNGQASACSDAIQVWECWHFPERLHTLVPGLIDISLMVEHG